MNILFTADIHIKLGQKNVPILFSVNRYKKLFEYINSIADKYSVEYIIIGGDIFDKLPSIEELELFFDLISDINKKTIIYSGNHEALKKNTTFLTHLKSMVARHNNLITIIDDYYTIDNIDFIPYNRLKEYHPADIDFHGDILCTHVRGEIPPHVKPEVPLELFDRWKLVLAGDLHSYENSQRNILYPGSPVTTSFHRNNVETGLLIVDTDTLKHTWEKLNLPQLIRKTINVGDPMPTTTFDHTIYEIEGDVGQLSVLENSELLDRKIVKRNNDDVTLFLNPGMTISQELTEYLTYVLELPAEAVTSAIAEFNDYKE